MDSTYTSLVSTLGIRLDDILDDAPIKYHSENVNSRPYFTRSTVAPGSVGTNRPIRLASGRTRCANSSLERGNLPGADNPGADNPVGQNTIAHIESSPESVVKGKITDVCADQDILKLQELLRVATINGEEGLYDYIFVGIISQHLDTVDTLLSNLAEDYSLRSWSIFYDLRDCQSAFLKEGGFLNEETPCSEAANLSSESEQHDKIVCAKEHDVRSRLILVGPLVTIDCLYNTIPLHIITNSQVFAYIPSSGQARGQSLVRGVDADSNVVWEGKLLAIVS